MLADLSFNFVAIGINPDMEQLHSISNGDVLSSIVDKLKSMLEEKFFHEIENSSKLILYGYVKEEFWEKSIFMRLTSMMITNTDNDQLNY